MESNKQNIIDLRIILLGDTNVGKKTIAHRFKILKSTETKEISLKEFLKKKNKGKKQKVVKLTKNNLSEEEKLEQLKENKRIDLMRFTKIFRMELNSIYTSFCPCPDAEILDYDYAPKDEEDENYEFEKEYKISIKKMIKAIEEIIIRPPDDARAQIEVLFLLCFDLSNFTSFDNLIIFFSQINKRFKLTKNEFKLVLIGNKLDIKKEMNNDEKQNFENFKNQLNLKYYEISSLMFFNFENFFEKLILDIYGNSIPFFSNERYQKLFHNILNTKNDFNRAKRGDFILNTDIPGADKYHNNIYEYPSSKRELMKIFKNKYRYKNKIFINKNSILFPPIKHIKEELSSIENSRKNMKNFKDEVYTVNWDHIKNEKVQSALELNSSKPGYSFGIKTNNSIGLRKERDNLRNQKDQELINKLDGYIVSSSQVLSIKPYKTSMSLEQYQEKYEENRNEKRKRKLEEKKEIDDIKQKRFNEIQLKNSKSFNKKMFVLEEKRKKYDNIREAIENEKKIRRYKYNTIEVDKRKNYNLYEPKSKFYDPVSSISTKKGFTFGQKLEIKYEQKDSPDFPTFMDDFEKLKEKNKKRNIVKSIGNRFPVYKTEEIGDSSYVMEKQKVFEKKRKRFKMQLFSDFFENRNDKKNEVINNKKIINENNEKKLNEQIKKSYKNDENYLIRDINYNQIESSSPKFTIKGKYKNSGLFRTNTEDDYNRRFATMSNYEARITKPNFGAIFPRHPAFSFGNAKRFDFFEISPKSKKSNSKEKNNRYDGYYSTNDIFKTYQDTQSFLMAQTSMGTQEKLKMLKNDNPGPGMYKIRGFADDVAFRGTKINLTRIKIREKEKEEELDKERRAKLREEWLQEKKSQLKMGIRDYYNSKIKPNNEDE